MSTFQFAFLSTMLFIMSAQGHEQYLKKDIIKVIGAGKGSYMTSVAVVVLGVHVKGATASEVQKQIGLYSSVLVEYLHGRSVDKLKTSSVSLWKNRKGFAGNLKVLFESSVKKTGEILEGTMVNGATSINSIRLKVSEEDVRVAQDEVIKDAVANARSEADAAATAAEREIIAPATIDVTSMFIPRPVPATHGRDPIQPTVQIVAEEQSATALVSVSFSSESLYEYEEYEEKEGDEEDAENENFEGEEPKTGEEAGEKEVGKRPRRKERLRRRRKRRKASLRPSLRVRD